LIPAGQYDAICLKTVYPVRRFVNLGAQGSVKPSVRPRSKLASHFRAIADFTGYAPSKIPLSALKQFLFRVAVRTVDHDPRGKPLPDREHYSIVHDVVVVISRLAPRVREQANSRTTTIHREQDQHDPDAKGGMG
jgi:hypothetical protein